MKKNARILSLLLSVAMVFGLMAVPTIAAEETTPTVTVANPVGDLKAGEETVKFTVTLTNNDGFSNLEGKINHNSDLELVNVVMDPSSGLTVVKNIDEKEFTVISVDGTVGEVILCNIEFKVLADIPAEEVDVYITDGLMTYLGEKITATYVGTKVTVDNGNGGSEPGKTPEKDPVEPAVCDKVDAFLVETEEANATIAAELAEDAVVTYYTVDILAHYDEDETIPTLPTVPPSGSNGDAGEGKDPVSGSGGDEGEGKDPVDGPTVTPTVPVVEPVTPEVNAGAADGCEYGPITDKELAAYIAANGEMVEVTLEVTEPAEGEYTYTVWYIVDGKAVSVEAEVVDGFITVEVPYDTAAVAVVVAEVVEEVLSDAIIIPRLLPVTVKVEEGAKVNTTAKFLIAYGARRTINITVEEGYEVADIIVNGKSVGAADSYTLKGVAKAQTIVIKTAEVVEEVVEEAITEEIAE